MVSMTGARNSSITRVRPIFSHLLTVDPAGCEWVAALWSLAAAKRPRCAVIDKPAIFGSLIPEEVVHTRTYSDRVLATYGVTDLQLAAAFERRIAPPAEFLRWLLLHPGKLVKPSSGYGASGENEKMRKGLLDGSKTESERIMQIGIQELETVGAGGSDKKWWAFEGFSEIDCCLVTNSVVLFIEGKRTEPLASSTQWYPARNQLWRNVEVASAFASGRQFGVILAVEQEVQGHIAMGQALSSLSSSYPHLSPERQAELSQHLLGFVTWQELKSAFDIPSACLPETVTDLIRHELHDRKDH